MMSLLINIMIFDTLSRKIDLSFSYADDIHRMDIGRKLLGDETVTPYERQYQITGASESRTYEMRCLVDYSPPGIDIFSEVWRELGEIRIPPPSLSLTLCV